MDQASFQAAMERLQQDPAPMGGIGTLGEKSLHRLLKYAYEPDSRYHEQPAGGFVADIVNEKGVVEIQTRGLYRLKDKAAYMLRHTSFTVVYPLFASHSLCYVDKATGEAGKVRRSPQKASFASALPELNHLKALFFTPGFCVELVLLEGLFFRDKASKELLERVATGYVGCLRLENREDFFALLPSIGEPFTAKEMGKALRMRNHEAAAATGLLSYSGVIERVGKKGNAYLYRVAKEEQNG